MGKKRTKSRNAPAAKKQKKAATDSSSEDESTSTTSVLVVAPVAKATVAKATAATPTKSPQKSAEDKKTLSSEAISEIQTLSAKAKTKKLTARDFSALNVNGIKNALRLNDRSTTGIRGALIEQTIKCMSEGCPPRCPECGGGRLKFGKRGKKTGGDINKYWCPGYMEDDDFINCGFTAEKGDIDTVPWKDPQ